jgi:hypothetical protein
LQVKLTLGSTLVREGKTAEGAAILHDLATTSQDPGVLNDAAYALADAAQDLPLAETAARHSLALLDAATLASAEVPGDPEDMRRASLLVAAWDTMGWVLYKEDKPLAAEPWLRAAWFEGNARDTGYHLAMALAAEGRRDEALRMVELADNSEAVDPANSANVSDARSRQTHDLCVEEEAALRRRGAVAAVTDAHAALETERTFEVARNDAKMQGVAMFQLRFGAGGVQTAELIGGDDALKPMSDALKQLKLRQPVPPESRGVVVRVAALNCQTGPSCELTLVPMDGAAAP